jgi:hypothetical protein
VKERTDMSSESDQMIALLHELSALKQIDEQSGATPNGPEEEACRLRQDAIAQEIKALAEKKTS